MSQLAEMKRKMEGGNSSIHGGGALALEEALDFKEVVCRKDEKALQQKSERARRREEHKGKEREEGNGPLLLDAVEDKNAKEIGAPVRDDPVKDEDEEGEVGGIHPDIASILSTSSLAFILTSSKHIQSSRVDGVTFDFNLAPSAVLI